MQGGRRTRIRRVQIYHRITLNIYIYIACQSVCLCPINVKMAELIGPKFCVGPYITQGIYLIKCDQALSYIYFYFNRFIFIIKSCMKCADFNILIYISLFFLSMHVKYPWGKGSQLSDVRTTVGIGRRNFGSTAVAWKSCILHSCCVSCSFV